jgi:hypothetical protein
MATQNLSGAPAYNRPEASSYYSQVGLGPGGGLVNQPPRQAIDMNLVNQQGNVLRDQLMQGAQGQSQRMQQSLAGRGFGSNSPVGIAQGANMEAQARNAGGQAVLQNRLSALQANNQQSMQWDQTRQQSELQRMQMAMGMAGQDQQLYGQQLGYLTSQQQMANEKQMQDAALKNALQIAQMEQQGQQGFQSPYAGQQKMLTPGGGAYGALAGYRVGNSYGW